MAYCVITDTDGVCEQCGEELIVFGASSVDPEVCVICADQDIEDDYNYSADY